MPFLQDVAVSLIRAAADMREYTLLRSAIKREKRISDLPASKREKPYRALIEEINHFLEGITNDEVKVDLRRLKTSIETQKIPQAQSAMLATQDSPRVEQCEDACFLLTCAAYCQCIIFSGVPAVLYHRAVVASLIRKINRFRTFPVLSLSFLQ